MINRETDALIVVDMQNDFGDPQGSLYVHGSKYIVPEINKFMLEFDTVVLTQDYHPETHTSFTKYGGPWPEHCVQGTWGCQFLDLLDRIRPSLIIRKGMNRLVDSYSAFRENVDAAKQRRETGLAGFLFARRIRTTYFVGLARDYCVKWSALDANGLNPHFVWDLTLPVSPQSNNDVLSELTSNGVKIV